MKDKLYIVFTARGIDRSTKNAPSLKAGEFLTVLNLTVPDDVFKPAPLPTIELTLTGPQIQPSELVVNGIAQELPASVAAANARQAEMLRQATRLPDAAMQSSDPAISGLADDVLDNLRDAGVEIRVSTKE